MHLDSVMAWAFPERCPACALSTPKGLCRHCRGELTPLPAACAVCALPLPVPYCPRRQEGAWHVHGMLAPYDYRDPLDRYIVALKFQRARRLGRALGLLLADAVQAARAHEGVDGLVPVPLHPKRLRERGYNQAFEIARTVSAELGLPLLTRNVLRRRSSAAQSGLQARERYHNVRRAFETRRSDLYGRRLAVIDDVITTGATVNALAAALLAAGAEDVRAWAVARSV